MNKNNSAKVYKIAFVGVMAAIVCVASMIRIRLTEDVAFHIANGVCLLSGLLLGPAMGGLAAGLGSAIYDVIGGYSVGEMIITFINKGAMAWVCGTLAGTRHKAPDAKRTIVSSIVGAFTYVFLFMLKTFIAKTFILGMPLKAVWGIMITIFPISLLNAAVAIVTAPILFGAINPALSKLGLEQIVRPKKD